jgi:DNA-binding NarL/FixJ family response regulator
MSLRILLVDDHAMFRAGLRSLLQSSFPDADLHEAGDGIAALHQAAQLNPDLVILDLHLPDQNGIGVARRLMTSCPAIKIIILSAESDLSYAHEAIKMGVSGYLLKSSPPEEMRHAIDAAMAGKLHLCPEANESVLEEYRQVLTAQPSAKPALSTREQEVLKLIAEGLRTKEIALRLNLGVKSVETYRRRLLLKLGCGGTAELVRYALRQGIIPP